MFKDIAIKGIKMRASQIKAAGAVVIVLTFAYGAVWFPNSAKTTQHLFYEVTIEPAGLGNYRLTLPTLVDGNGVETSVAGLIAASGPAELTHVDARFGRAILVNASGALVVGVEVGDWGGTLNMLNYSGMGIRIGVDGVKVYAEAVDDFLISIAIKFRYDSESERSNIFGAKDGMWGGGFLEVNASGSIQSRSNWTVLDGAGDQMNWDGAGNAFLVGFVVSLACYPLGIGVVVFGKRKRDIDQKDWRMR